MTYPTLWIVAISHSLERLGRALQDLHQALDMAPAVAPPTQPRWLRVLGMRLYIPGMASEYNDRVFAGYMPADEKSVRIRVLGGVYHPNMRRDYVYTPEWMLDRHLRDAGLPATPKTVAQEILAIQRATKWVQARTRGVRRAQRAMMTRRDRWHRIIVAAARAEDGGS